MHRLLLRLLLHLLLLLLDQRCSVLDGVLLVLHCRWGGIGVLLRRRILLPSSAAALRLGHAAGLLLLLLRLGLGLLRLGLRWLLLLLRRLGPLRMSCLLLLRHLGSLLRL